MRNSLLPFRTLSHDPHSVLAGRSAFVRVELCLNLVSPCLARRVVGSEFLAATYADAIRLGEVKHL
jgi:hypothetical protein